MTSAGFSTISGKSKAVTLAASDADRNAVTLRIVSQPAHGTVALKGSVATYFPEPGFVGTDSFTFAAWDGSIDSNLARVTVTVAAPVVPVDPGIPGVPSLQVSLDSDSVVLSWPAASTAVVVETLTHLEEGVWEAIPQEPVTVDGISFLTVPDTNSASLFRVRVP